MRSHFSYIRKSVQDVIEANQEIRESENIPNAAPLLVDGFLNLEKDGTSVSSVIKTLGSPYTLLPNSSIWHNSIAEGSIFDISKTDSIPQIGIAEISIPKSGFTENSASEISIAEVSTIKTTLAHLDLTQVGINQRSIIETGLISPSSTQISTIKDSFSQINSFHVSSFEISPPEIGIAQVSTLQNSSFQIGSTQISPAQVIKTKIQTNFNEIKESSKVSLSSSVPFQEFFNIHNLPVASTNKYKDNLLNFWQTFTNPTNPFDLTFQITDLPTGQLAEAQITQFDSLGRPNGGTLLIDHNANGIGWYIDPTPFDHSEFTTTLTDTAFRATTNSPAAGRYDLLTTLLHEMGHLAGFIDGYSGYDSHIQTLNGSQLFVGDNFSATLTPDRSHLDPKLYPYDLMNPTLTPGDRKFPSLNHVVELNTLEAQQIYSVILGFAP